MNDDLRIDSVRFVRIFVWLCAANCQCTLVIIASAQPHAPHAKKTGWSECKEMEYDYFNF